MGLRFITVKDLVLLRSRIWLSGFITVEDLVLIDHGGSLSKLSSTISLPAKTALLSEALVCLGSPGLHALQIPVEGLRFTFYGGTLLLASGLGFFVECFKRDRFSSPSRQSPSPRKPRSSLRRLCGDLCKIRDEGTVGVGIISCTMYQLNVFRESNPPQNRELTVLISNRKQ